MYRTLLFTAIPQVDAKQKFALLAFVRRYGVGASAADRSTRAQHLAGVSTDLEDLLRQLVALHLLKKDSVGREGVGRPHSVFSVASQLRSDLMKSEVMHVAQTDLINVLIDEPDVLAIQPRQQSGPGAKKASVVWVGEKPIPRKRNRLSSANRLLLAVLLAHADSLGVVEGLSTTELTRLTGMSAAGLSLRLDRLGRLGFIRWHVPGIASPIFAKKLKSSFLLNLNHPQLSRAKDPTHLLLYLGSDDRSSPFRILGGALFERNTLHNGIYYQTPLALLPLFNRAPSHAFAQLEFFVARCASSFLARSRSLLLDPDSCRRLEPDKELREQVRTYFRHTDKRMSRGDGYELLVSFFCQLVVALSQECVRRFYDWWSGWSESDVMIYPVELGSAHRCLALLVRGAAVDNHTVLLAGDDGVRSFEVAREAGMDVAWPKESRLYSLS